MGRLHPVRDARFNKPMQWRHDGYLISTDRSGLDVDAIWQFLRTSYWATGVAREVVEQSIENSLPFGMYAPDGAQAGFARVVTDRVRFAWLADVFVLDAHRGRGLGVWLVQTVVGHPDVEPVRILLGTNDAHGLYERFGFRRIDGGRMMERPGIS
jgi:GNAT superfamily N-acetyltransferase